MSEGVVGPGAGLTVLDDPCRGCGACCEYMGAPPGYSAAYPAGNEAPEEWRATDDEATWRAMPAEVRGTLDEYYRAVREGVIEDRELNADPCIWYDPAAGRCVHYAWRPRACRDFEAGGTDCLGVREYAGR